MRNDVCPVFICPNACLKRIFEKLSASQFQFVRGIPKPQTLTSKNYFHSCVFAEGKSLGAGLTGSCELLGVGNQEKAGQQEEQQVLADAEVGLQAYL